MIVLCGDLCDATLMFTTMVGYTFWAVIFPLWSTNKNMETATVSEKMEEVVESTKTRIYAMLG